jgi:hypothetical protein
MVELAKYLRKPAPDDVSLERFIGECLTLAGVWDRWRESDGISRVYRFDETPELQTVCAGIYQISDQQVRYVWLVVRAADPIRWTLGLDPHSGSERRAQEDLEHSNDLTALDWDRRVEGVAEIRDGILVPTSLTGI